MLVHETSSGERYQRTTWFLRQKYGFGTTRMCTSRVNGATPISVYAVTIWNFAMSGIAVMEPRSGLSLTSDHRYGATAAANHEEPQGWKTATYTPLATCTSKSANTIQSIAVVTTR